MTGDFWCASDFSKAQITASSEVNADAFLKLRRDALSLEGLDFNFDVAEIRLSNIQKDAEENYFQAKAEVLVSGYSAKRSLA